MRRLLCVLLLAAGARLAGGDDGPGAPAARGRETERLLAEVEAEAAARRAAGDPLEAAFLEERVSALRLGGAEGAQPGPSDRPEAHVVAVREGMGSGWRGRVRVHVTVRGRPIVLVLSSYQPIYWEVETDRDVDMVAIFTAGHEKHELSRARGRVGRLGSLAAFGRDDPAFPGIARELDERAGCGISTLTFVARATLQPIVVGPGNREWEAEHLQREAMRLHWRATAPWRAAARAAVRSLRFPALYHWRGPFGASASFGDYTPLGPLLAHQRTLPLVLAAASVCVRDAAGDLYLLREGVPLRLPRGSETPEVTRPPDTLPSMFEPCGLAVDSLRERLLLATRRGAGYLYALDLRTREWSVVNDLDHVDASAVAYDARRDALLCVEILRDGAVQLHLFRARDGQRTREIRVGLRLPGHGDRLLPAACVDGKLILLDTPTREEGGPDPGAPRACVIEPNTGEVLHAAPMRIWEDFAPLSEGALERAWSQLLGSSDERAERATRRLAGQGDATVDFLARRLQDSGALAPQAAAEWIELLGADDPGLRLLAHHWLERAGEDVMPMLRRAEAAAPSPEARRRAAAASAALQAMRSEERLRRATRAIRVLEWIETPAAMALLRELREREHLAAPAAAALRRLEEPPG